MEIIYLVGGVAPIAEVSVIPAIESN